MALIAAVLGNALRDATESDRPYTRTDTRHAATNARDLARAWIASDSFAPWSFCWCCDYCDADPGLVRAQLSAAPAALNRQLRTLMRRERVESAP
ncbi:MAG: hypothetical protein L0H83_10095 [Salinisphaera sp.]|nr:hypothetical protein [Salinisphaera sp.]